MEVPRHPGSAILAANEVMSVAKAQSFSPDKSPKKKKKKAKAAVDAPHVVELTEEEKYKIKVKQARDDLERQMQLLREREVADKKANALDDERATTMADLLAGTPAHFVNQEADEAEEALIKTPLAVAAAAPASVALTDPPATPEPSGIHAATERGMITPDALRSFVASPASGTVRGGSALSMRTWSRPPKAMEPPKAQQIIETASKLNRVDIYEVESRSHRLSTASPPASNRLFTDRSRSLKHVSRSTPTLGSAPGTPVGTPKRVAPGTPASTRRGMVSTPAPPPATAAPSRGLGSLLRQCLFRFASAQLVSGAEQTRVLSRREARAELAAAALETERPAKVLTAPLPQMSTSAGDVLAAKDKAIADKADAKARVFDTATSLKLVGARKDKALKAEAEASKKYAECVEALDHARAIEQPTIKAYMADAAEKEVEAQEAAMTLASAETVLSKTKAKAKKQEAEKAVKEARLASERARADAAKAATAADEIEDKLSADIDTAENDMQDTEAKFNKTFAEREAADAAYARATDEKRQADEDWAAWLAKDEADAAAALAHEAAEREADEEAAQWLGISLIPAPLPRPPPTLALVGQIVPGVGYTPQR